jgi:hypothetical protein
LTSEQDWGILELFLRIYHQMARSKEEVSMKFFIPGVEDDQKAARIYSTIKSLLSGEMGFSFTDEKIFRIQYLDVGTNEEHHAKVGERDSLTRQIVVAILHGGGHYYVCTETRGVAPDQDYPIDVSEKDVRLL